MATNIKPLRNYSVYLKAVIRYNDVVKSNKSTNRDTAMINNNKTMDKPKSRILNTSKLKYYKKRTPSKNCIQWFTSIIIG